MKLNLRIVVQDPESPFEASAPLHYRVETPAQYAAEVKNGHESVARDVRWFIAEELPRLMAAKGWIGELVTPLPKLLPGNDPRPKNGNGHENGNHP